MDYTTTTTTTTTSSSSFNDSGKTPHSSMSGFSQPRSAEIIKCETKERNGSKWTEYIIDVATETGDVYTISRRYKEFLSLCQLMKHYYQVSYPFPPKKLNKLNATLVENRKTQLQAYIKHLITNPSAIVRKSTELFRFLDASNAFYTSKLVTKKVTLEDAKKKTLELKIVEGKDIKLQGKSMWDVVSYVVYDFDRSPTSVSNAKDLSTIMGPNYKSNSIAGPFPCWDYKQNINIKNKKVIYFEVFSSLEEDKENSKIGHADLDLTTLGLNNYAPIIISLPLSPHGGEILVSLVLV